MESVPAPISRADEHDLVFDLERGVLLRLSFVLRGGGQSDELLTCASMRR